MIFITLQEIIEDQDEIITKYGGARGIRDIGLLASAIEMAKSTMFGEYLHPTIFDKAAAYLYHIVLNHPFVDGNKRVGTVAALTFLRQNNVYIQFTEKESLAFEELIVSTAEGKITKEQIAVFLKKCYKEPEILEEKIEQVLENKE
jgi:death-on-curing protein